ncbi:MAG TPA: redoxin domain-containing protein [Bacteroidetes bacterium]|nr:redoxin domain-containing protein [Bacteroidota bacterium]
MNLRSHILIGCFLLFAFLNTAAQTLDSLPLVNVDSSIIHLGDFRDRPAVVLIFTGNHCVYSKKYEERIIEIAKKYQEKGIAFLFVNSNSPALSTDDRLELMRNRAIEKKYPCPYVQDRNGALARGLGASKNPEAILGKWDEGEFLTLYSGKIDDNPLMANRVENHYLIDAIKKLLAGDHSPSQSVEPIGCGIKMQE